jgi:hypothetical protein
VVDPSPDTSVGQANTNSTIPFLALDLDSLNVKQESSASIGSNAITVAPATSGNDPEFFRPANAATINATVTSPNQTIELRTSHTDLHGSPKPLFWTADHLAASGTVK